MSVAEREEVKAEKAAEKTKKQKREKNKREKRERRSFMRVMREVGGELKKVRWPTFAKTLSHTGVVLGVVVVFSLVVFGIDQGLTQLYRLLVQGL